MRPIEFRAKTANPNELPNHKSYFVYGLLRDTGNPEYPISIDGCFIDTKTISQFTGLHDRNRKKVFENDDVKLYLGQTVKIKFIDGKFVFWLNENSFAPISQSELQNAVIVRKDTVI